MEIENIPHIIAAINSLTLIALIVARMMIKSGNEAAHKKAMVFALSLAALFLVFYLYYHANSGLAKFGGEGIVRPIYFTVLIVHIIGAAAIVPLVPMAVYRALKGQREKHKRLVRYTWPLWVFVTASGILVYVATVHIWPCDLACQASGIPGVMK